MPTLITYLNLHSYNAFEASFETTFPSSFSVNASETTFSLDEVFNDSNSFFTDVTATTTLKDKSNEKSRDQSSS